jgi:hypothetical protein
MEIKEFENMLQLAKENASLDLSMYRIGDTEASLIAKFLEDNRTLASLDLRNNEISHSGFEAIANALKNNITITSIDFTNDIEDNSEIVEIAIVSKLNLESKETNTTENNSLYKRRNDNDTEDYNTSESDENSNKKKTGIEEIKEALQRNRDYVSKVANFLCSLVKKIDKDQDQINDDLVLKIKYLKDYQALDKKLLLQKITKNGIEDTNEFIGKVDKYIKEHFFTISGVAKSITTNDIIEEEEEKEQKEELKIKSPSSLHAFKLPEISSLISDFLPKDNLWSIKLNKDSLTNSQLNNSSKTTNSSDKKLDIKNKLISLIDQDEGYVIKAIIKKYKLESELLNELCLYILLNKEQFQYIVEIILENGHDIKEFLKFSLAKNDEKLFEKLLEIDENIITDEIMKEMLEEEKLDENVKEKLEKILSLSDFSFEEGLGYCFEYQQEIFETQDFKF